MAEGIIVIGAGGFGRETLDVIEAINAGARGALWDVVGVVDDAPAEIQVERLADRGIRHLGGIEENRERFEGARYVVGIGSTAVRARIADRVEAWGARPATLVHPAAVIGTRVVIAAGAVVCGGAQISTNIRLGRHAHVNPAAVIGHDSILDDHVSVNPGAIVSGEVHVGAGSLIGAGATILQGLRIGAGATVGAGACVTRDVAPGVTVVGVPAREVGATDE
ncbi:MULTISPECIES: NeuD/PglB/VioB family sugar acetyltransferase [unclassified Microbacterium]|uniref:NeuD/PglB/VioB family sugar acetyltransferase n=1 Tax=unclassified Microbacterium TaxID=2609290 RepID=UPI001DAC7BDA|nr:NeuD/PglB/VioB family sugar acetyltransferase [Microbacterium sp.]MBS1896510.1 NeuD/PglB/VioB family sugar acetyltransferase [Actinomycetota bacterium]